MTTLTKVLIGAAAVTTVAVVVKVVKGKKEEPKKEAEETTEENEDKKKESLIKRIKDFVLKKVIRILGWVALHMEQIEAASAIIGLVGAVISITTATRDFIKNNDICGKLDAIDEKVDKLTSISKGEFKALYDDHNILAKNQVKIAKAVGVSCKE